MAEKQPTAYVVCRYTVGEDSNGYTILGDNIPVKVFDTRREARDYCYRMGKRSRKYDYTFYRVKQG